VLTIFSGHHTIGAEECNGERGKEVFIYLWLDMSELVKYDVSPPIMILSASGEYLNCPSTGLYGLGFSGSD
jgi:hypothetical protein